MLSLMRVLREYHKSVYVVNRGEWVRTREQLERRKKRESERRRRQKAMTEIHYFFIRKLLVS
jgi:hypothetical protein